MKKSTFDSEKSAWETSENPRKNSLGYTNLTPFEAFNNMEKMMKSDLKSFWEQFFTFASSQNSKLKKELCSLTKRAERLGGEKIICF